MRAHLDDARDGPAPDLLDLAKRVARLRPDWQEPQRFFEERSDLAHALRRIACNGRREGLETRTRVSLVPTRERRLVALARGLAAENRRLQRLLAQACRPPPRRRRRPPDDRHLALL
jgi:hypothetical protein